MRSAAVDASIGWPVAKPGFAPLLQLLAITTRSTDPVPFGGRHRNAIQPPPTAIGNLHTPTRQWLSTDDKNLEEKFRKKKGEVRDDLTSFMILAGVLYILILASIHMTT
jgi:hypothetical protein